jgi:hypothetical protein
LTEECSAAGSRMPHYRVLHWKSILQQCTLWSWSKC